MKKLRCPFCPKAYESYKKLKRHMEKIHDGSISQDDVEKFSKRFVGCYK